MKAYRNYSESEVSVEVEARIEGNNMRVFFDFETLNYDEDSDGKIVKKKQVRCECVEVPGSREYNNIVSSIVRDRYSDNDIQAVLANYAEASNTAAVLSLTPEKKEEYLQEYADFQQWRAHAKDVAHKVLELI